MPTLEAAYFRTIDFIKDADDISCLPEILRQVCAAYNLKTAAYFGLNVLPSRPDEPYLAVTYSSEWVEHYKVRNYVAIDPVIRGGFDGLLPMVWNSKEPPSAKLRSFFGEACEFGIGGRGLTLPIRGRGDDRALFTITSDDQPQEWSASARYLERDFQMLAHHLHEKVTSLQASKPIVVPLTAREIECLKWAAQGKSYWDISVLLSIKQRTVEFHLRNAREKLDVVNSTQAAAKALSLNML